MEIHECHKGWLRDGQNNEWLTKRLPKILDNKKYNMSPSDKYILKYSVSNVFSIINKNISIYEPISKTHSLEIKYLNIKIPLYIKLLDLLYYIKFYNKYYSKYIKYIFYDKHRKLKRKKNMKNE